MTVEALIKSNIFTVIHKGKLGKKVTNVFCCDLLSIAMSRIPEESAWVTVMGNVNTIAVASLTEVSCIILAEGIVLDEMSLTKAKEQDITVFYTKDPIFEASLRINKLISHD